jgi:hypothetical protein
MARQLLPFLSLAVAILGGAAAPNILILLAGEDRRAERVFE